MTIVGQLLAALQARFEDSALPRVKTLHLPPAGATGKDGEFCALELDDGALGMTYVLLGGLQARLSGPHPSHPSLSDLPGADALQVARGALEADDVRRTVGFAAINALTRSLFDRAGYVPPAARDSFGGLAPGPGDHVAMIGLFARLLGPLLATGARVTVLELRADLAGGRDGCRITLDPDEIAGCNKVLSTSTVLLNGTLVGLIDRCCDASRFDLIGPGAGCLPEPLFALGVTSLGGTWIEDPAGFKAALARGARWGDYTRKFVIERSGYRPAWSRTR